MRSAWILPVALHSILAFAAPAAEAKEEVDAPVYGNIKLTYATPSPSTVSLNLVLAERDVAAETGSCLTKPTDIHTKSRTRARHHIRTCGESGGTCLPSSTGIKSGAAGYQKDVSSSAHASSAVKSSAYASSAIDYTTTVMTTIYETYCPGTSTVTEKGSTYAVTYPSSSKVTETFTTTVPVKATPSSVAAVSSMVPVTYTSESTYYETKTITRTTVVPCEGTYTYTSETVTKTSVFPSSSTTVITETSKVPQTTTLTVTTSAAPSSTKAATTSKAEATSKVPVVTYTSESTYYETYTIVETVTVPCTKTETISSKSSVWTTEYPSTSEETTVKTTTFPHTKTVTVTSSAAVVPSSKAVETSSAEETPYSTTVYTVVYTTTCPGTKTITSYGTTITQTYASSTVTTETITKSYPVTTAKSSSKSRHHSHSRHGHTTSELVAYSKAVGSSSGAASSKPVKSSGKASSSRASSTGVSSKASSASASASSVSASASSKVSSKASSAIPSSSASKSKSKSACSTPTPEPKCVPCEGQPGSDPEKWCGLTINDDSYKVTPKTCRTVVYDFEITNTTISPDGVERLGLLVNGQMPGPTIEANWGDTIIVHVHNKLQDNGTSIHFHGSRQNGTNEMDGATSVTQCPIAPGESFTYKFRASNYGHSWYHSHFALQTYNGVFGPMIIHGPHSAEYDVDAGVLSLQDWSHLTVDQTFDASQTIGPFPEHGPRTLDLGLINGQNVWQNTGERFVLDAEFESGKSYLLRLINVANQASFKFYIDGHSLQVISADYVPIKPYTTNIVNIHPGQRYEVIVKADQTPGSYWIRSDSQDPCSAMTNAKDVKGVVNYKGFYDVPTTTAYNYTEECVDEPLASMVPIVGVDAGAQDENISKTLLIGPGPNTPTLYKWTLDGSTFVSRWDDPSLYGLAVNGSISNYAGSLQLRYPKLGEWVYLIIQSPIPVPHPVHLHGHDFLVLSSGLGFYTGQPLNLKSPPRRDTALMPSTASSGGYLVVAWQVDNPGAWLAHCHVGYHAAMGFTLEIIEGEDSEIEKTLTNSCAIEKTCAAWKKYTAASGLIDTGI